MIVKSIVKNILDVGEIGAQTEHYDILENGSQPNDTRPRSTQQSADQPSNNDLSDIQQSYTQLYNSAKRHSTD